MTLRSHLYIPGDQPAMLARALERGADAIIIDLEDAVAPSRKDEARRMVHRWLAGDALRTASAEGPQVWVRVNGAGQDGLPPAADLAVAVQASVSGVLVAKSESGEDLVSLDAALSEREAAAGLAPGHIAVAALVESAAGVQAVRALAAAPRVLRLQIGEADLAADLGMPSPGAHRTLAPLRLDLVVASAAARIEAPVGPVYTAVADAKGLRRTSMALRCLGFVGRTAIHPSQVPIINEAFTPTDSEVGRAVDVLQRFEAAGAAGRGVTTGYDGGVLDEAVVRSARAVVKLAAQSARRARSPGSER